MYKAIDRNRMVQWAPSHIPKRSVESGVPLGLGTKRHGLLGIYHETYYAIQEA